MNFVEACFAFVDGAVIGLSVKRFWAQEGQTIKLGSAAGVTATVQSPDHCTF